MGIIIEEINTNNAECVNIFDGEFVIDEILTLHVDGDQIRYEIVEVPQTTKRYECDEINLMDYIDKPNRIIYFAYVDEQIAGQIVLRKNWNKYAYVEDIVVDKKYRRQRVGQKLISQAKQWAQERNLPGIMLETQNNNVIACKFYERNGFQLGGFDKYLYQGINRDTGEVALYWYLLFQEEAPPNPALNRPACGGW